MKSTCLVILASLTICNLAVSGGQQQQQQQISSEDEAGGAAVGGDAVLQRAEGLLLRSILQKLQDQDARNEGFSSQSEWVTKRQHPGKRYSEDLEKRQHPGRRQQDGDGGLLWDVQKRQHPGKREDEMHSLAGLHKRQHPGKRLAAGLLADGPAALLSELSKRQHPGKRYLVLHSKRQHPGKRDAEDEDAAWDWDGNADADAEEEEEEEDVPGPEKRQHPGKRFWDTSSPDLGTDSPCDFLDAAGCGKTSLLLDFLDNIHKSHAEEKRQHPGKRFAPEEEEEEEEEEGE